MIKINLATRKRSGLAGGGDESNTIAGITRIKTATSLGNVNLDDLKIFPIRRLIVLIAFALLGGHAVDYLNQEELTRMDELIQKAQADQAKLRADFNKTKSYVPMKKALDDDERALRTKLETIQTLLNDRTTPPKLLLSLSNAIPGEVWLTEFKVKDLQVSIRGSALSYNAISDFMKSLGENAYFTEVNLKDTQQSKENGANVAVFELTARRMVR